MFKAKFNHDNLELYKPDNQTIGNSNFFKGKIARLPEYYYDVLEANARIEYSEEDRLLAIAKAREEKAILQQKLKEEYEERELVVINENTPILCNVVKCELTK